MDQNEYLNRLINEFSVENEFSENEKKEFLRVLDLLLKLDNQKDKEIEIINLITNNND